MDAAALAGYVGGAARAAPLLAGSCLIASLILQGRSATIRLVPAAMATGFFLGLALLPLPDPATFDCARSARIPRLYPFSFISSVISHTQRGVAWHVWFGDLTALSAAMNLILCGVIGLTLGAARCRALPVMLFALLLPLIVEFTQLTGFWGIYACPYRHFDIDDIILNFSGVALGYAIWRLVTRRK